MPASQALFSSDCCSATETFTLSRKIAAVQLVPVEAPHGRLGAIVQLPRGAHLDLCGEGYDDRTVKVRWEDNFYFVFLEDLQSML
jgi:hypothetical protein